MNYKTLPKWSEKIILLKKITFEKFLIMLFHDMCTEI
jgi:hypothetical protein